MARPPGDRALASESGKDPALIIRSVDRRVDRAAASRWNEGEGCLDVSKFLKRLWPWRDGAGGAGRSASSDYTGDMNVVHYRNCEAHEIVLQSMKSLMEEHFARLAAQARTGQTREDGQRNE